MQALHCCVIEAARRLVGGHQRDESLIAGIGKLKKKKNGLSVVVQRFAQLFIEDKILTIVLIIKNISIYVFNN